MNLIKFKNASSRTGLAFKVSEQDRNGLHDFTKAHCAAASYKGSQNLTQTLIYFQMLLCVYIYIYAYHILYTYTMHYICIHPKLCINDTYMCF